MTSVMCISIQMDDSVKYIYIKRLSLFIILFFIVTIIITLLDCVIIMIIDRLKKKKKKLFTENYNIQIQVLNLFALQAILIIITSDNHSFVYIKSAS